MLEKPVVTWLTQGGHSTWFQVRERKEKVGKGRAQEGQIPTMSPEARKPRTRMQESRAAEEEASWGGAEPERTPHSWMDVALGQPDSSGPPRPALVLH